MNPWTEESETALRELWTQGHTGGEIARALCITRNAVIGKVHRLGMEKRRPEWANGERKPKPEKVRVRKQPLLARVAETTAPIIDDVGPPASAVTFDGLQDSQCKWPYSDPDKPDFCYCGGDRMVGFPYCAGHVMVAYMPVPPRKR